MIFGKTQTELKVGIFAFIGLVLLAVFVLSIGGIKTWTSGYRVTFVFNFINGAKVGAPVRFAGVDVGEVQKIKLILDPTELKTKVKLLCWVRREVVIPADSAVWVNTLGLLGERYIEIMPGTNYVNCLTPGQELVGVDPLPIHEMARLVRGIVGNLDQGLDKINSGQGTIGKLIYDDKIYNDLEAMVADLRRNPWKLFWKTKEKK
jgi:phospholipid/cholesterol/gamma-HCH transport system substrate-binding protein